MKPSLRNRQHRLVVVVACLGLSVLQVGPRSWAEEPKPPPNQSGRKEKPAKEPMPPPSPSWSSNWADRIRANERSDQSPGSHRFPGPGRLAESRQEQRCRDRSTSRPPRRPSSRMASTSCWPTTEATVCHCHPRKPKLVRFRSRVWTSDKQLLLPRLPAPAGHQGQATLGARRHPGKPPRSSDPKYEVVEPKPEAAKDVRPCWMWQSTFEMNAGLGHRPPVQGPWLERPGSGIMDREHQAKLRRPASGHFTSRRTCPTGRRWLTWHGPTTATNWSSRTRTGPRTAKQMKTMLAAEPRLNTQTTKHFSSPGSIPRAQQSQTWQLSNG